MERDRNEYDINHSPPPLLKNGTSIERTIQ